MVRSESPLRIVFFGTPDFAVPTLEALVASRHPVVGVVTQPDRPKGRGQRSQSSPVKQVALHRGVSIFEPVRLRDEAFLHDLRNLGADLGVVAAYGKILTETVLAIPRLGLLNVHASLLPRYRGAAPVHRAIMAGERETGVTIMRVVKALDAGPMLSSIRRPISESETSADVERDLSQLGASALVDAIEKLAEGRIEEQAQDDSRATYADKLVKEDGIVDWQRSARDIHNQIRGLHPWPHAYADLEGERTILLRSAVDDQSISPVAPAGTVLEAHGDCLRVQTGDGTLRLLELQRAGRSPVSARAFLAGRPLQPGVRFSSPQARS
jgi:methionyl-tRNA formyltransferase